MCVRVGLRVFVCSHFSIVARCEWNSNASHSNDLLTYTQLRNWDGDHGGRIQQFSKMIEIPGSNPAYSEKYFCFEIDVKIEVECICGESESQPVSGHSIFASMMPRCLGVGVAWTHKINNVINTLSEMMINLIAFFRARTASTRHMHSSGYYYSAGP